MLDDDRDFLLVLLFLTLSIIIVIIVVIYALCRDFQRTTIAYIYAGVGGRLRLTTAISEKTSLPLPSSSYLPKGIEVYDS